MAYEPRPIDTEQDALPDDLVELEERLAENIHELWAAQRILDGWRYGPARNDDKKEHPGLVPYAELPEAEKVYDRNSATGTLRAILALGYRIVR